MTEPQQVTGVTQETKTEGSASLPASEVDQTRLGKLNQNQLVKSTLAGLLEARDPDPLHPPMERDALKAAIARLSDQDFVKFHRDLLDETGLTAAELIRRTGQYLDATNMSLLPEDRRNAADYVQKVLIEDIFTKERLRKLPEYLNVGENPDPTKIALHDIMSDALRVFNEVRVQAPQAAEAAPEGAQHRPGPTRMIPFPRRAERQPDVPQGAQPTQNGSGPAPAQTSPAATSLSAGEQDALQFSARLRELGPTNYDSAKKLAEIQRDTMKRKIDLLEDMYKDGKIDADFNPVPKDRWKEQEKINDRDENEDRFEDNIDYQKEIIDGLTTDNTRSHSNFRFSFRGIFGGRSYRRFHYHRR